MQGVSGYAVGVTPPEQYAATIPQPIEEFEHQMHQMGFCRNNLACLKHRESGQWSSGSWVYREWEGLLPGRFAKRQLHVTLYTQGDNTLCYAHDELNPWRHPLKHLDEVEFDPALGVDRLQEMLRSHGVGYVVEQP